MESKELCSEKPEAVFLIDTDIQLLNAIRYVMSHGMTGKVDAIIQMKSRNAYQRIGEVRSSGLFCNVYTLELDKHGIFEHLEIGIALIVPRTYLKHKHHLRIWKKYEKIYLAFSTKTFDFVIAGSGCKHIIGYDDGMGSYIGNPFLDNYKRKYLFFRRITGNDYLVNTIYLNNPGCYQGTTDIIAENLICDSHEINNDVISRIFSFSYPDALEGYRFLFLNQAITDTSTYIEEERKLAVVLEKITGDQSIIRLHPSERRSSVYKDMRIDTSNNMWELICSRQISNKSVLISFFSTAQFSPKLMNDKEPYIIFTYKLFQGFNKKKIELYERYIQFFKQKYREGEKIYIPETLDEYSYMLEQINNS